MYHSESMTGLHAATGDLYNPCIHKLHITLMSLQGTQRHLGPTSYLAAVTADLKRLTKFKHSKSSTAKAIAEAGLQAYEPLLSEFMTTIKSARPGETFVQFMRRNGDNWGRVRAGSTLSVKEYSKFINSSPEAVSEFLRRKHNARQKRKMLYLRLRQLHYQGYTKDERDDLRRRLELVYHYTGYLYAAYDIASFPDYFDFLKETPALFERIQAIGKAPTSFSIEEVVETFKQVQQTYKIHRYPYGAYTAHFTEVAAGAKTNFFS